MNLRIKASILLTVIVTAAFRLSGCYYLDFLEVSLRNSILNRPLRKKIPQRRMILHPSEDRILKKEVPVGANKLDDAAIEGFQGTGETVSSRGVSTLIRAEFKSKLNEIQERGEIGSLKKAFQTMSEGLETAIRSPQKSAEDRENTFDSVMDVIFFLDRAHRIVRLNRTARALVNAPYQTLINRPIFDVLKIPSEKIISASATASQQSRSFNIDIADNQVFEIHCNSLVDKKNDVIGTELVVRDITARLEEKLQRANKMEAIGTLAGGVAHDLNNILSGIVSYPELLLLKLPKGSPLVKPMETILQSGKKAAPIVQDLLTLARRGTETFAVLNVNTIVNDYLKSPEFNRLKPFHANVEISTALDSDSLNVEGSFVHLSKVIMKLVSTAAETMPQMRI